MLGNQEIDYGYYTNGWKNEFHQESCFEAAVTGLVCLFTKHHAACIQSVHPKVLTSTL
jgi:hypothetical protein